ncbi:MAG: lactate racemase domain-containing protein [Elusimicrobia bacterium]|nr:lactate racemase domain-containing protein [Elusimicrobiota bacterium]
MANTKYEKDITLSYGDKLLSGFIPHETVTSGKFIPLILPKKMAVIKDVKGALVDALENPIGDQKSLSKLIKDNYKNGDIAIIVDDHERPNIHTRLLLPILIDRLTSVHKISSEKIKVVIATGTHRPSSIEEIKKILGEEMFPKVNYVVHKCRENNVEVGKVDNQVIRIDSAVFNSDITILLTDIDNHYFTGVSGGPKAFCPGVSDMETITYEHLKMFGEFGFAHNVDLGNINNNPVFETKKKIVKVVIESLRKHGREVYSTTSIVDPEGDLVYLKGGETFESHLAAAKMLKSVWTVNIKERADIVISGAGHWGINLYQMGKATHCAYHAVKNGGIILNVAPCNDGWGNEEFKNLMKIGMAELNKYKDRDIGIRKASAIVVDKVKSDYRIGKQKPVDIFQILYYVGWGNIHIIQDGIPETDYNILPFMFWGDKKQPVEERLRSWLEKYLQDKTIIVTDNPNYLIKVL